MTRALLSLSGGKDSVAMAILLAERGVDYQMVMADTGWECPETHWIVPRVAATLRRELIIVNNGSGWMHLHNKGYFLPSWRRRWCTAILKQQALNRYHTAARPDVVYVGIRADEPSRIPPGARREQAYTTEYPLVDAGIDKREAQALCARYDLLSPIYQWRSSTSCFCCPLQRLSDWQGLLTHHPDLYALAEDWEEQSVRAAQTNGWQTFRWRRDYALSTIRRRYEPRKSKRLGLGKTEDESGG